MLKEFIFSCPLFGGFRCICNVQTYSTLGGLVLQCVKELRLVLQQHNLNHLLDQLKAKTYHIHDQTIDSLLTTDSVVYICDCGPTTHNLK
jgi:hypothetical protein